MAQPGKAVSERLHLQGSSQHMYRDWSVKPYLPASTNVHLNLAAAQQAKAAHPCACRLLHTSHGSWKR